MQVICLGILVADIFASPIDRLPAPGHLKLADRFILSPGGCAANTAANLGRLGIRAAVIGKVGQDFFGDFVLGDLARLGVDVSMVKRSGTYPTSTTLILNVAGEDRRFIHCIGANADLSLSDVVDASLKGAKIFYVGGYLAMPALTADRLAHLFSRAKDLSLTTVLDVVIPTGSPSIGSLAPVLKYTDVFMPNEDEAQLLTGLAEPRAQTQALSAYNPDGLVVITRGDRGVVTRRGDEVLSAGGFRMKSVDNSGAGDAFAAGFITGMLEGWPLEQTVTFASAVGASCTTALGCLEGVFNFDQATRFVSENPLSVVELEP